MKETSPSSTALLISRCLLLASRVPSLRNLLAAGDVEALGNILGSDARRGWIGLALRSRPFRTLLLDAEQRLLPGIIAHYLARKRWIEREVRSALCPDRSRCVVVGAGFDTLALRLSREMPDIRFVEIDHPATQRVKQANVAAPPNLSFIPADLGHGLPSLALHPSVIVAEGVTMYLAPDQVADLLGECGRLVGPHGRVIFTFMEPDGKGRLRFHGESPWISWWLRWRQEPFRWGSLRENLPAFLNCCGLRPLKIADHLSLRGEILRPLALTTCHWRRANASPCANRSQADE